MAEKEHEQLVFWRDPQLGYRGIITIHDTTMGPALGGTRYWNYDWNYDNDHRPEPWRWQVGHLGGQPRP